MLHLGDGRSLPLVTLMTLLHADPIDAVRSIEEPYEHKPYRCTDSVAKAKGFH